MSQNTIKLSTVPKAIVARECRQSLTGDAVELVRRDNNDRKAKHDCLKKLNTLDIW